MFRWWSGGAAMNDEIKFSLGFGIVALILILIFQPAMRDGFRSSTAAEYYEAQIFLHGYHEDDDWGRDGHDSE